MATKDVTNILTFDVEDWFQVHNLENVVKYKNWNKCELRIEKNIKRILRILEDKKIFATFFVLGWIAKKHPEVIEIIKEKGHEIATHGYRHRLLYTITQNEFSKDLTKATNILRKITKTKIIGHRAPSFSITNKTPWAFKILKEKGFKYDSSIFPIKHPDYGMPEAKTEPYKTPEGIIEFPLSTIRVFRNNVPFGGGGYFRVYPYWLTKYFISKKNKKNKPAIVYLHPWEFDKEQPKLKLPFTNSFRHYYNLKQTEKRLKKMLYDFKFVPIREYLNKILL